MVVYASFIAMRLPPQSPGSVMLADRLVRFGVESGARRHRIGRSFGIQSPTESLGIIFDLQNHSLHGSSADQIARLHAIIITYENKQLGGSSPADIR